jgi:hypothetical protein
MKAKRKELSEKLKKIDMRNGSLFASFRCEAKKTEAKPAHRREIIYCKRAILSLSSSKILTPPPPPSPPGECVLPPNKGGGYTLARRGVHTRRAERGMGGQYFGRRER